MPAACKHADTSTTGHPCSPTTGVAASGNTKVFIQGALGLVKGDPTMPHTILSGNSCVPHSANINAGSGKVFYCGIAAARIGDSCDGGAMISGSAKVNAG